jgi:ribose transport system permease protein
VGTMVEGLMLWYSNGEVIFEGLPAAFIDLGRWQWGPVRAPAVYLVVIAVLVWLMLRYTPAGRYLHAIGGNRNAARISGVRVNRYVILAFALSGLLAAVGGIVLAARNGSANPSAGTPFLLPAFAAAFLGSVTLRKGEFHVVGTIVGVYLIAVGSTGFVILGAPFFTQQLFSGAVLIFATAGSRFVQRRKTGKIRDVPASAPELSDA